MSKSSINPVASVHSTVTMKAVYSLPLALASYTTAETVKLSAPDALAPPLVTLDGAFQGYSMELASFPQLAGNLRWVKQHKLPGTGLIHCSAPRIDSRFECWTICRRSPAQHHKFALEEQQPIMPLSLPTSRKLSFRTLQLRVPISLLM